ncbi:MAG: type II secretion system protein [Clostridiales bacterium]|nr:type II secretion system protein [Clostridiales bacterium]
MKKNNKKGFTIVELVIVIAVIAILAAVLIPTFTGVTERAKENAAMQNARNAWTEYMAEYADKAEYKENICIKSTVDEKDYYFHVVNGEFNTEAVAAPNEEGTTAHTGCAFAQATVDNGTLDFQP